MTTERELRYRAWIHNAEVEEDEVDKGDINGKEGRQKRNTKKTPQKNEGRQRMKSKKKTPHKSLQKSTQKQKEDDKEDDNEDGDEDDKTTKVGSPVDDYRERVLTRIRQQSSGPFDIAAMANLSYIRKGTQKGTGGRKKDEKIDDGTQLNNLPKTNL